MRILLAGDSHGVIGTITDYLEVAKQRNCKKLFVLGDFGYWEHEYEGVKYLDEVDEASQNFGIPVYFLDGNHDKTSMLLDIYSERDDEGFIGVRPSVLYSPRGHRWTWDGLRFVSFGGAYSVDKAWRLEKERLNMLKIVKMNSTRPPNNQLNEDTSGTLWFPEEEMTDADMEKFLTDTTPVDIMLAHDKPTGSNPGIPLKDDPACRFNQDRLRNAIQTLQPKMFFHGHLHHRYVNHVRSGDDTFTEVIGLGADGYDGSGYVLNLENLREGRPHHF